MNRTKKNGRLYGSVIFLLVLGVVIAVLGFAGEFDPLVNRTLLEVVGIALAAFACVPLLLSGKSDNNS